jgi:hypothetical protein
VNLIKIDMVGLQAAERRLHCLHYPASRIALLVRILAHGPVHLGGQHDVVAPAFQCLADDLLRLAAAIPVGGVDEVDAGVQGFVDDADAVVVVGIAQSAEHHRAQAIRGDFDSSFSERAILHGFLLFLSV